jgi:hypothetical protein
METQSFSKQKIYILEGGFYRWQSTYKDKKPTLIEAYDRKGWEQGFFE